MANKSTIKKAEDLITTREQTRAGFISFALEKNKRSTPLVENAKSLKVLASKAKNNPHITCKYDNNGR